METVEEGSVKYWLEVVTQSVPGRVEINIIFCRDEANQATGIIRGVVG